MILLALSGSALLGVYLTLMAVLIGGFFFLRQKFRKEEGVAPGAGRGAGAAVAAGAGGRNAAGGAAAPGAGRRARGALGRRRGADDDEEEGNDGAADAGEDDVPDEPMTREERKAAEKEAARAAKAAVREAQEAAEASKRAKGDKYAAKAAAREAEREAAEREAAEEAAKRAEEQRKKDAAEFDQWKDMFEVSGSGTVAVESLEETEGKVEEFIQLIKKRKVVVLDELAVQFGMKTPDVIQRIQQLEADGRLTGVLDDRGKFLAITNEELEAVAKWIQKRGRVTVADLVAESNKLIDLNGTEEETKEELVLEDDSKEQKE